ncbi:hypothetical protein D3C81_1351640 [compost metagenome]
MSCMPNHAASADTTMNGTQMKPAFWSQSCCVAPLAAYSCPAPPSAPKTATETTTGVTNCTTETPRLPMPAFRPVASPLRAFGKKKLMFAIDELKLAPPSPHSRASTSSVG